MFSKRTSQKKLFQLYCFVENILEKYRDEINSLQIQLSRTQAGPGRAVKEQQEQNSPNHVQKINLISVNVGSFVTSFIAKRMGVSRCPLSCSSYCTSRTFQTHPQICICTEGEIKVCTWLREISSCSCLTVLPGPAWVLLSKTCKPLFTPLYMRFSTQRDT